MAFQSLTQSLQRSVAAATSKSIPAYIPPLPSANDLNKQNDLAVTQKNIVAEGAYLPVILGRAQVGGKIFAIDYDEDTGTWTVGYAWSVGENNSIAQVWLDGAAPVTGVTVNSYVGTTSQTADALLSAAISGYTDALVITRPGGNIGVSYSVVQYEDQHYRDIPQAVAEIEGLKTNAGVYSDNPGYCVSHLIAHAVLGLGASVDYGSVPTDNDATVITEARRKMGLVIDEPLPFVEWLTILAGYMSAWITRRGSQYYFISDRPKAQDAALTSDDWHAGSFAMRGVGQDQIPTVVELVYTDTTEDIWREQIYTVELAGVSGGSVPRRVSRVRMPGVTRRTQAAREATERLNKLNQQQPQISFTGYDDQLVREIGDVVDITRGSHLTNVDFRIIAPPRKVLGDGVQIQGAKYDATVYSDIEPSAPTYGVTPNNIGPGTPTIWINARERGALGIGTDDTTALQAAIDELELNTADYFSTYGAGGTLYLPAGVYVVTGLTIMQNGIRIVGESRASTVIVINSTSANTIYCGLADPDDNERIYGVQIENVTLINIASNPSAGAHIYLDRARESLISNVALVNHYRSVAFVGVDEGVRVEKSLIQAGGNTTALQTDSAAFIFTRRQVLNTDPNGVQDSADSNYYVRCGSVHISDCEIKSSAYGMSHCFDIRAIDGLYVTNCHIAWAINNLVRFKPVQNNLPMLNCFFNNCLLDATSAAIGDGTVDTKRAVIYEVTGALSAQPDTAHHYFTGCSLSGNDDISLWIQDGWTTKLHDLNFNGVSFKNATGEGAKIESGFDITFDGCNFDGNDSGQVAITGITQANPAVVTAADHGFSNGNTVVIRDVVGMVEVNNTAFTVANVTGNTFELSGINSTSYTAYSSGGTATEGADSHIYIDTNKVTIDGCKFSGVTARMLYLDANANYVNVRGGHVFNTSLPPVLINTTNRDIHIEGVLSDEDDTVASAGSIYLSPLRKVFHISGTTTINTIQAAATGLGSCSWDEREVILIFDSTASVGDGTGNISLAGTFSATANDVLHLRYSGSDSTWHEVSRSVN